MLKSMKKEAAKQEEKEAVKETKTQELPSVVTYFDKKPAIKAVIDKGKVSPENSTPCAFRASERPAIGRSGSLPPPEKDAFPHTAAAIGSIKRKVDPLSMQSRTGSTAKVSFETGVTWIIPGVIWH